MNRNDKLRNLLVAGINKAVESGAINLHSIEGSAGSLEFEIFGKPSKFSWQSINAGELRVTIWWGVKPSCLVSNSPKPLNKNLADAVVACCSGWLERKDGIWLQGNGSLGLFEEYCSKTGSKELEAVENIVPVGYEKFGRFYP